MLKYLLNITLCLLLLNCSRNPTNLVGSETGNGNKISGVITQENGQSSPNTVVQLLNASENAPEAIATDTTNDEGVYSFTNIDSGLYNIEAYQVASNGKVLIPMLILKNVDSSVELDPSALQSPGVVKIILPDSLNIIGAELFIPGTSMRWIIDSIAHTEGVILLDDAFPGNFDNLQYSDGSDSSIPVVDSQLNILSNDTTLIDLGVDSIIDNKDTIIDSTILIPPKTFQNYVIDGSNLGISQYLTNYPILFRLNDSNIHFSELNNENTQLKFKNENGDVLPFEVESWDSVNNTAEIWVLLDTLNPGDDSIIISMNWDSTQVLNKSDSVVFKSDEKYHAVWHITDADTSSEFKVLESSVTNNTGVRIPDSNTTPLLAEGIIGNALLFDKDHQKFRSTVLDTNPSIFSLSFWFKTTSTNSGIMIAFNGNGYDRHIWMDTAGLIKFGVFEDSSFIIGRIPIQPPPLVIISSTLPYNDGNWHYAAINFEPNNMELYLDGELLAADTTADYASNHFGYWQVGASTIGVWDPDKLIQSQYEGLLDEIRVQYKLLEADRIKLNYLSQKEDASIFKKQ